VLGLAMLVLRRPVGELVVNSVIVFPAQPTCAMTVSLLSVPNENMNNRDYILMQGNKKVEFSILFCELSLTCLRLRNSSLMT
jgi:hypothetical protein